MTRAIAKTLCWIGLTVASLQPRILHAQQGPALDFAPAPGSTIGFAVSAGTPVQRSIVVTPSGGSAGAGTGLLCFVRQPVESFTAQPAFSTIGSGAAPQTLTLRCTPSINGLQLATLQCEESRGAGAPAIHTWSLSCPSFSPVPVFASTPASGQPVVLGAAPGTQAIGGPVFGNLGLLSYNIIDCTATGGFSVLSVRPLTVASGASVPLNVACTTPAVAGTATSGMLDCHTSIPGVSAGYPLQCAAVAPPPDAVFASSFEADALPP